MEGLPPAKKPKTSALTRITAPIVHAARNKRDQITDVVTNLRLRRKARLQKLATQNDSHVHWQSNATKVLIETFKKNPLTPKVDTALANLDVSKRFKGDVPAAQKKLTHALKQRAKIRDIDKAPVHTPK